MTLREKILYHQIHPLKLAADISCEPVSLYFFWKHDIFLGLTTHFIPPLAASLLLLCYANLGPCRMSKAGAYLRRHMTRPIEGIRFVGDLVMVLGAWLHKPSFIFAGVTFIVLAWANGFFLRTSSSGN